MGSLGVCFGRRSSGCLDFRRVKHLGQYGFHKEDTSLPGSWREPAQPWGWGPLNGRQRLRSGRAPERTSEIEPAPKKTASCLDHDSTPLAKLSPGPLSRAYVFGFRGYQLLPCRKAAGRENLSPFSGLLPREEGTPNPLSGNPIYSVN